VTYFKAPDFSAVWYQGHNANRASSAPARGNDAGGIMSHQIWHVFYYDRAGDHAAPCRSEVIQAANEEAAARVARAHMGDCHRATLETASWMQRVNRVITAEDGDRRRAYLH
jgi:hypothetical protein